MLQSPSRSTTGPARPTVGNSYDNALAETTNGRYKAERVYGPDATGLEDLSHFVRSTLLLVHWFNEQHRHGYCDDVPPTEFAAAFYAAQQTDQSLARIQ